MRRQYLGLPTITVRSVNTRRTIREERRLTMEKPTEYITATVSGFIVKASSVIIEN